MKHGRTGLGVVMLVFALAGCGGPRPTSTSESGQPRSTPQEAGTAGPPLATKNMPPVAGQQKLPFSLALAFSTEGVAATAH